MKPSFILRGLCATALVISLAACGGGGGDSAASATPPAGNGNGQPPAGSAPQAPAPVLSCAP